MEPTRWRKKPVEVQAIRFDGTGDSASKVTRFVEPDDDKRRASVRPVWADRKADRPESEWWVWIRTLEGVMEVAPGDWVIQGVAGEFYPCKPGIFAATYEAVNE